VNEDRFGGLRIENPLREDTLNQVLEIS